MRIAFLTGGLTLLIAARLSAGLIGPLSSLSSDGSLLDISSYLSGNYSNAYVLNTDNSTLYYVGNTGGGPALAVLANLATRTIAQSSGPTVRVFDFSTFTVAPQFSLNIVGTLPAAILATGDISISGSILANSLPWLTSWAGAGGGAGGLGEYYAPSGIPLSGSAAGGGGGQVGQDGYDITGGGGAGGGNASSGQNGNGGTDENYQYWAGNSQGGAGGIGGSANSQPLGALNGGGGGGGGGNFSGCCPQGGGGGAGGNGGGGLFFSTPGNFLVGNGGTVSASGTSSPGFDSNGGGGGGGAGGDLWFDVAGTFTNRGLITAAGGSGSVSDITRFFPPAGHGGAGSGGIIFIDPSAIVNDGIIDVSDGNGGSVLGGIVNLDGTILSGSGQIEGEVAPEPGTVALLAVPMVLLAFYRRRRDAVDG